MPILNVKGIEPKLLDIQSFADDLTKRLLDEGEKQRKLLEQTVRHWKEKPKFEVVIEVEGDHVTLIVRPTGPDKIVQIWGWIDGGTKPYTIVPHMSKALRFQVPYSAGSRPGTFKTSPARRGSQWVSTKVVRHPGIKARRWTELLQKKRKNYFYTAMRKAASNIKRVRHARGVRQAIRPQRR